MPTLYRASGLEAAYISIKATVPDVEVIIAHELGDERAEIFCKMHELKSAVCEDQQGPAHAWNEALKVCPDADIYILASDDVEFIPGWYEIALKALTGLVGMNDGTGKYERTGWATQYMMTREFIIKYNGGVVACPHYRVDFTDVEICERAKRAGVFSYCPDALVVHHWRVNDDEGYREADKHRAAARKVYEARKAKGFPNDYEPILRKEQE